jgi:glycosyltransferase involved in cell wall biosynthesis
MDNKSPLTLIIPCYNEEENIPSIFPEIIEFCKEHHFQLIAVNDGSIDNTLIELEKLGSDIQILNHSLNRGYGAAIKTGIKNCKTPLCITIDADGQHCLSDILRLIEIMHVQSADLVVGNRQQMGSSLFRNIGKWIILSFTKLFLKLPITDLNSGMKLYKTEIARSLVHWTPNGMAFSDVVTLMHFQLRYKITECNIDINPRVKGTSTINWMTAVSTISEIAFLIVNIIPFKFFSILSLMFFMFGIFWGLQFVLNGDGITVGSSLLLLTSLVIFLQGIMFELLVRMKYQNYSYPEVEKEQILK